MPREESVVSGAGESPGAVESEHQGLGADDHVPGLGTARKIEGLVPKSADDKDRECLGVFRDVNVVQEVAFVQSGSDKDIGRAHGRVEVGAVTELGSGRF